MAILTDGHVTGVWPWSRKPGVSWEEAPRVQGPGGGARARQGWGRLSAAGALQDSQPWSVTELP